MASAVIAVSLATSAVGADLAWRHDGLGRPYVSLANEITQGDAARITLAITHSHDRWLPYLLVESPGGNAWEGLRLARLVRRNGIAVAVGKLCASACFTVLAGARERFASPMSRIAVHRAAAGSIETPGSDTTTLDMASFYRAWGMPLDVIGAMASTAFEDRFDLTPPMRAAVARVTPDGLPPARWRPRRNTVASAPSDEEIEADVDAVRGHARTRSTTPSSSTVSDPHATGGEATGLPLTTCLGLLAMVVALRAGWTAATSGRRPTPPMPSTNGCIVAVAVPERGPSEADPIA